MTTQVKHRGRAARGYIDPLGAKSLLKISVGWTRLQVESINRRVIRNNTTFGGEARRLMDIGLAQDHINDPRSDWKAYNLEVARRERQAT